ncbi:SDR family NAD(P)-dependent oxidoreductase [Marinilactibacillus sp. Marseille-P9653]|uniref:SDR family NAD(P)-dependent oxidoreductase n=1 Tax=Marinilactibacillus sp. Marseille-P9653 TaxID=2866583 RepID=UPI002104C744|nr:SDR family NAD(P)-dependent oxidoreductase [Marinilactibacillus sp. Marseille-P9653]
MGSLFGDRGTTVQSTYSAAKFAVHGWTENLRMEAEKDRIPVSVTLIHPGRIDTPYNEHAQSYLEKQPGHRGMIYPPEAVAEAILFAAEHPKRDMFVGGQAKLLSILGKGFPRLMDKIEEYYAYPTQHISKPSILANLQNQKTIVLYTKLDTACMSAVQAKVGEENQAFM